MRIKNKKEHIDTPALLLDLDKIEFNLTKAAEFFKTTKAVLRPHIKTHKCPILATKQVRAGAIGVTCAKVGEAEVMAKAGISDILIANQVVGAKKIMRLMDLLAISDVKVAVESEENLAQLSEAARDRNKTLSVLIEVDVGMNRCGVKGADEAVALAKKIDTAKGIELAGIMGYEGHIIFTFERAEREKAARECMEALVDVGTTLRREGFPVGIISGGGTGTYDVSSKVEGITEIQAGSYLTMDATYGYLNLGFAQALTLLTTVIAVHGNHAILDCGMKSLTYEFGMAQAPGIEGAAITSLSEEHGHMTVPDTAKVAIGDKIELVPTHGCTTINLHDTFYAVRGDNVEAEWEIAARGKFV
jgi:D-serine deaminase-like pyridoxal phosphate-dependent protein